MQMHVSSILNVHIYQRDDLGFQTLELDWMFIHCEPGRPALTVETAQILF